jgi:8-oxo-dGTP pyrophosphatase MutT (NUDIX family)
VTYEVSASRTVYDGAIISMRVDTVTMPDGTQKDREVVEHAESAAIVAVDNKQQVLLIEQYRHAVGRTLIELPAGLRDDDDPDLLATAQRELREEVGLTATQWSELVALRTSPGILTEFARVFLARGLTQGDREPDASSEEQALEVRWVPLGEAVGDVRAGRITDAMAVAGLLAAHVELADEAGPSTEESE